VVVVVVGLEMEKRGLVLCCVVLRCLGMITPCHVGRWEQHGADGIRGPSQGPGVEMSDFTALRRMVISLFYLPPVVVRRAVGLGGASIAIQARRMR
jgi:hypothetical protein